MPVPKPTSSETESEFVGRCMSEIGGEYDQTQALAICYTTYRRETGMSGQQLVASKIKQLKTEVK